MGSAYSPADLQSAYKSPVLSAWNGQTVAIVDAFDDPNAEADLQVFRSTYGLPVCSTANSCFEKVDQTGGHAYPAPNQGWAGEISLDVDMVSAICPYCHILLVEANNNGGGNLAAGVNEAVAIGATEVSNSYGGAEYSGETGGDSAYTHAGIPITASTGDGGYGTSYPAVIPGVIAVGGTSLAPASTARRWYETAWGGAGSGCSTYEPKPSWQHDFHCANRMEADISAVADPGTPVSIYDTYGGGSWGVAGGTSVSAPLIAGMFALSAASVRVSPGASLYRTASSFFDPTQGTNDTSGVPCDGSYFCVAGPGYDGPTGLGSPDSGIGVPPLVFLRPPSVVAGLGGDLGYVGAFEVDQMGQLWEKPYCCGGHWQPWVNRGFPPETVAASNPATVATADPYLGVWITAQNGALEELYNNGTGWLWRDHLTPPGTTAVGTPNILHGIDGFFSVSVRGKNGHLFEFHDEGAYWVDHGTPAGTTITGDPTSALNPTTGIPDAFAIAANGALEELHWSGSTWDWAAPATFPAGTHGGIAAVSNPSTSYEAVFVPIGGHVWEYYHDSVGWHWADHGLPPGGGNAILTPAAMVIPNFTEVFVTDSRGHLDALYYDTAWHWADQGTPGPTTNITVKSSPALVNAPTEHFDAWVIASNNHLEENYYQPPWHWIDQSN